MMTKFEVGIFNKEVREAVARGERHRNLSDNWADIYYVTIKAADQDAARQIARRKYPAQRGYVVDSIVSVIE